MGQLGSKLRRFRRGKRRVYLANSEEEEDKDEEAEGSGEFVLPLYQPDRYEETTKMCHFVKQNMRNDMLIVKKQAQQAIIDATIVSTRKNTYGNEIAQTDLTPNPYILKSMLSRGTRTLHDEYIQQNEKEMLNHVALAQTIMAYRSNDFIDDHYILHHNDAYFSSTDYFLVNEVPSKSSK